MRYRPTSSSRRGRRWAGRESRRFKPDRPTGLSASAIEADGVPLILFEYNVREQRLTYCNQHCQKVLGYSSPQLLAMGPRLRSCLNYKSLVDETGVLDSQQKLAQGQTILWDCQVHHRNGSPRWLRMRLQPRRNSQRHLLSGSAEDITQQRQNEQRRQQAAHHLAEQHRLFRQVIDSLPSPVYLRDGQGRYKLANQALARLYGVLPDELVRIGLPEPPPSQPADQAHYQAHARAQDQQVLTTHQDLHAQESHPLPSGELRWFSSVKRLFVQADGTELVLGIDNDITELKNTQLALEQAIATAEENARVKEDFLANMSHEIRTPLHGIIGLTGVLAKTSLSPSQHDYLRLLNESAEHLLSVLDDVLTTARLGAGKLSLEATAFTPHELLTGCAALLRPRAREKGLRLRVEAGDFPAVLGDAHRLRQVLLNLVSNAVKFTDHGQVLLRCQNVPAPPSAVPGTIYLQFSVIDTGIGIAPEVLDKVFEPFTQAAASTTREYGGTGLGLSISQGLVELLGGKLTVSSEVGKGSTFSFTLALPLRPPHGTAEEKRPVALPDISATGRVLLVEDNLVNSLLAETILRNWGWQVTAAANGPAAIQLFANRPFDVVLMDIQMPGMDGETTAQALRQHPDAARARTPIIALTARAQPGEAERLRKAGFAGYLTKPYRAEQLNELLQSVLVNHSAEPRAIYSTSSSSETPMDPNRPLYNLTNVRQLVRNDESVVRRLAWAFISTTPAILTALDEALTESDWVAVGDAAHHLKSSLDGLGVDRLRTVIRAVENYGDVPSTDYALVARQVADIRAVTEQVMADLRKEFPEQM